MDSNLPDPPSFRTFVVRAPHPFFPSGLIDRYGRLWPPDAGPSAPTASGAVAAEIHRLLTEWVWTLAFQRIQFGPLMHSRRRTGAVLPQVLVMLRRQLGHRLGRRVYQTLPRLISCFNCRRIAEPVDIVGVFLTDRTERPGEFYYQFAVLPMLLQSFVWACCRRCASERNWFGRFTGGPVRRGFQRLIRSRLERENGTANEP